MKNKERLDSNLKLSEGNFSISLITSKNDRELSEINKKNKQITDKLKGLQTIDNNPFITSRDVNALRVFASFTGMTLFVKNKTECYLKDSQNRYWFVEKSFQYKPFVRRTIFYRWIEKVVKTTREGGKKVEKEVENTDLIPINKGEQLSYNNKVRKHYYKYGNKTLFLSTEQLIKNNNCSIYALVVKDVNGKAINVSHFLWELAEYESLIQRHTILKGKDLLLGKVESIGRYFDVVINNIQRLVG
ncbi:MAG: hypothetical protein WDA47_00030 [Bacilli bacterium]|jgi:hypothetical protein